MGLSRTRPDGDTANNKAGASRAGTVAYMAPELLCDDVPATTASDCYSFGACMWELITGRPPWNGREAYQVRAQRRHQRGCLSVSQSSRW